MRRQPPMRRQAAFTRITEGPHAGCQVVTDPREEPHAGWRTTYGHVRRDGDKDWMAAPDGTSCIDVRAPLVHFNSRADAGAWLLGLPR